MVPASSALGSSDEVITRDGGDARTRARAGLADTAESAEGADGASTPSPRRRRPISASGGLASAGCARGNGRGHGAATPGLVFATGDASDSVRGGRARGTTAGSCARMRSSRRRTSVALAARCATSRRRRAGAAAARRRRSRRESARGPGQLPRHRFLERRTRHDALAGQHLDRGEAPRVEGSAAAVAPSPRSCSSGAPYAGVPSSSRPAPDGLPQRSDAPARTPMPVEHHRHGPSSVWRTTTLSGLTSRWITPLAPLASVEQSAPGGAERSPAVAAARAA